MKFLASLSSLLLFFTSALTASDEVHKLSVSGQAEIHMPADTLNLSVGIVTFDPNAKKALRANADKMSQVMEALKKIGLTKEEIQTGEYEIIPQYTPSPAYPPPNWQPTIAAYEVRNILNLHTPKIEMAGDIIDAAGNVGANYIQNISFTLRDPEAAKSAAISLAFNRAESYALAAVRDSKVQLGDILDIGVNPSYMCANAGKGRITFDAGYAATPISPKDVEVTATVSVTYSLVPR